MNRQKFIGHIKGMMVALAIASCAFSAAAYDVTAFLRTRSGGAANIVAELGANTLIGAQIVHMEFAEANIVTDQESTMSAESVIRDADMAKSSLELATAQILSQAGQAMLSQSNQNSSNVLSLLQ